MMITLAHELSQFGLNKKNSGISSLKYFLLDEVILYSCLTIFSFSFSFSPFLDVKISSYVMKF